MLFRYFSFAFFFDAIISLMPAIFRHDAIVFALIV